MKSTPWATQSVSSFLITSRSMSRRLLHPFLSFGVQWTSSWSNGDFSIMAKRSGDSATSGLK